MVSVNHTASSSAGDYSALFDSHKAVDVDAHAPAVQEHDYSSYDEFCMMLRIRAGVGFEETHRERSNEMTTTSHLPKKFSYVSNWRANVDASSNLTIMVPPSPLFHSLDPPSSPVASIDPSRLYVTSIPPSSEYETSYHITKEDEGVPPAFHHQQLYDALYTPTLDDDSSTIETSSSLSAMAIGPDPASSKVHIPVPQRTSTASSVTDARTHRTHPRRTVGSTGHNYPKPTRFRNVSSAIRWLPTRIKYSVLSQTAHRGASRK
ncbi:hypothetical protein EV368DRAFT_80240 [Lentinula lateritia]|nr:hypothetical protein EV368DRAFT_80240 [Lentinula lateritia]